MESKKPVKRIIACPNCRKSVTYDASNPWRPFCSERCKTMDIAAWADESFRIPGPPSIDELDEIPLGSTNDED